MPVSLGPASPGIAIYEVAPATWHVVQCTACLGEHTCVCVCGLRACVWCDSLLLCVSKTLCSKTDESFNTLWVFDTDWTFIP